jgi:hypothetical protein
MKTNVPESVVVNGRKITYNDFYAAISRYGDEKGYSFDEFAIGMSWLGFVSNKPRPDRGKNETYQTVLLPVLEKYL